MKAATRVSGATSGSSADKRRAAKKTAGARSAKGRADDRPSPAPSKRSVELRAAQALRFAKDLADKGVDWITIGNALFGIAGKLTRLFPDVQERAALAGSRAYKELCELLDQERDEDGDPPAELADRLSPASGQTMVRMPRSLHAALLAEAEAEGVSLNQLCVSKLAMQLRCA